jgi:hypothetical protein
MSRRLVTTYSILGRCQAPPPPSTPPPPPLPPGIPESNDDLGFDEDDDEGIDEHPELAPLNAKFRVDEEWEAGEEAEEDNLDFDYDGPTLEEKPAKERVILASYESLKKAEADARAHEEANEEQVRHALDVSIQRASTKEAGRRLFAEERHRLLEDAAE